GFGTASGQNIRRGARLRWLSGEPLAGAISERGRLPARRSSGPVGDRAGGAGVWIPDGAAGTDGSGRRGRCGARRREHGSRVRTAHGASEGLATVARAASKKRWTQQRTDRA